MVSEGFVNFIPKEDRSANSRDLNPLETVWIIETRQHTKIQPPNTGRAKTVTTLRLEECDFGHALGARGGYSHTLAIRVCAAQRGRDFEAPWAPGGS